MERRERRERFEPHEHVVVDLDRVKEVRPAMHDPVPDGVQLAVTDTVVDPTQKPIGRCFAAPGPPGRSADFLQRLCFSDFKQGDLEAR